MNKTWNLMMVSGGIVFALGSTICAQADSNQESHYAGVTQTKLEYSKPRSIWNKLHCKLIEDNFDEVCNADEGFAPVLGIASQVKIKSNSNGTLFVTYSLASTEGCSGVQKIYTGRETDQGAIALFDTNPNGSVDGSIEKGDAQLIVEGDSIQLELFHPLNIVSDGGRCEYSVETTTALNFKAAP